MLTRHLKLKLYKSQEAKLLEWLWILTGVYNWASRRIKQNANNKIYFSEINFRNSLPGVSKRLEVPSHTIQATLLQSYNAWTRCFKKISKEPRLKGVRNKLSSIPFPDPIKTPKGNRILIPGLGETRFHKQDIPEGKIKCGRIIKKASGWYLVITIDATRNIDVKETESQVGIDTGFKTLITCSDGTKYDNTRIYVNAQKQMAKVQRGKNKKKIARYHERLANRRKDRNHKISLDIVRNHKEIFITNDNLARQAKKFGKSVGDAGIGQLRQFIIYKGSSCGRKVVLVDSYYTTMTCSQCWNLTGPTKMSMLGVRDWVCSACGAVHDRDINSAMVVLKTGLGRNLKLPKIHSKLEKSK